MHRAYKSDKPGLAPDCGMRLEPVYAGGDAPQSAPAIIAALRRIDDEVQKEYRPQNRRSVPGPRDHTFRSTAHLFPGRLKPSGD
jgi:hypothetical protein